ncbi:MAG: hypothetical protein KatS3mg004_0163 [Bryobacteraceae bacterium]|nr:MAG: hypothetical protein KatS3mg004_0163 [Bryobacteraceae bacterium]
MRKRHDNRPKKTSPADTAAAVDAAELEILIDAEEKLTKIRDAMRPLVEHLDHVRLRYGVFQRLQQPGPVQEAAAVSAGAEIGKQDSPTLPARGASQAGKRRSRRALRDASTAMTTSELPQAPECKQILELMKPVQLPELRVFGEVKRPEVTLSALSREELPEPEVLVAGLESYYNAFNALWKAALSVELGPEIRIRLDDGEAIKDAEEGLTSEARAVRELRRAMTRNSIQGRYERLNRVLDAVRSRRELLQLWTTPDGRRQLLRDYLDRHQLTVERFAEILDCQPMTIHNWRTCKGKGLGPKQRRIEDVLRKDIPPNEIEA